LTPVAIHEAMCFAKTVFENKPTSPDHEHVPSAVFTTSDESYSLHAVCVAAR
jgi:glutathione reductase (NADPH)